jgi:sulfite reductase beta subunit-like hemoprotein
LASALRIVGRDHFGLLPDGLSIVEGARELGATGEWLLLTPRVYLIRIRLPDGTLSPEHAIELTDFQQRTEDVDVEA